MHIAYFTNQYPGISHSFIRREIQALERAGVSITRFAIRPSADAVIANEDIEEAKKTRHIVSTGKIKLLMAMARQAVLRPVSTIRTFADALRLGHCSEAGLMRHILYFGEALVLAEWLRAAGIAHVHAHFGTNAAMIAMLASRMGDATFSMTVHGPEEFEKPNLISLREKTESAAFTVAISKYGAAQLRKLSSPDIWSRIKIVHCGIEPAFHQKAATANPESRKLVCVGRLCAEKAQIDLVTAFAGAAKKTEGITLSLIGDGPMRSEIENVISSFDLSDSVFLEGWKTPAEVTDAILEARVFALPSYAEGLPVSIMEALSLRRPVISTYIAGIPELVIDGRNGWLAPAGDIAALEAAIVAAMTTGEEALKKMGENGRAAVLANHDIDREAQKLVACFANVAGSSA